MAQHHRVKVNTMYIQAPVSPGQVNKNKELANNFLRYCAKHPEERFWQALRNWSGSQAICIETGDDASGKEYWDTFNWEGKDK